MIESAEHADRAVRDRTRRPRSTSATSSPTGSPCRCSCSSRCRCSWRRVAPLAAAAGARRPRWSTSLLLGTSCPLRRPPPDRLPARVLAGRAARPPRRAAGAAARRQPDGRSTSCSSSGAGTAVGVRRRDRRDVVASGRLVRARGLVADELRARTAELREARDERARLEVAADRARLSARARRRCCTGGSASSRGWPTPAPRADDTASATALFAEIERESRRTLEEMRAVGRRAARGHAARTDRAAADAHPSRVAARPREGRATRG